MPLQPPITPQLARGTRELPETPGWVYEHKLDGFRTLVFVRPDGVMLQSRTGKDLTRYFPEVTLPTGDYVLDGELVISTGDGEDFDALSQRIHPAASRIALLARETPATLVVFDLLEVDGDDLTAQPLAERRARLAALTTPAWIGDHPLILVTATDDLATAHAWLEGDIEGVVAKRLDRPYEPGSRANAVKVKRLRTADCVVMGYREGKEAGTVGSLMLGLYDGDDLRVVGHTSGLKAAQKRDLVAQLAPYLTGETGTADPSRWRPDDALHWVALRPELVVEVAFDQVSGGRIRHGTRLLRWRDDKPPAECGIDQIG